MIELGLAFAMLAAPALAEEPAEVDPFDPEQYPPLALADVIHGHPCGSGKPLEVKDALFSSELTYRPVFREVPKRRRELIFSWTRKLDSADQAAQFSREIRLEDGRAQRWFPVAETLIGPLKEDLAPGDRGVFYMSLIGCVDGEPVVAVEEYGLPGYEDLEDEASSYIA